MSKYIHYYRCGCVNWAKGVWVTEKSESGNPGFLEKQHFQLQQHFNQLGRKGGCLRYLRFAYTERIDEPHRAQLPLSDPEMGRRLVRADAKAGKIGPTIAVMWDPQTGRWYHGRCSHGKGSDYTQVPAPIVKYITDLKVDVKDWAFGWNCAEVECLIKAYANGKPAPANLYQALSGCYFVALNVASQKIYGACRTCKDWIKKYGGNFDLPN